MRTELFDIFLANSSTKQTIQMSESKRPTRKDDPMDVNALNKRLRRRKIERKQEGERPKPHEQRQVLDLRRVIMAVIAVRCGGQRQVVQC